MTHPATRVVVEVGDLNDVVLGVACRSSRSHAIFTITIHRTVVEVMNELGEDFRCVGVQLPSSGPPREGVLTALCLLQHRALCADSISEPASVGQLL